SGIVDEVGEGVPREWIGRRVWCYGAQSYRPFGTAAEYTVVRSQQGFKSSITCRWNKGPVSASRHNRPSGSSCHRSNRGTEPFSSRVGLVRWELVPFNSPIERERE